MAQNNEFGFDFEELDGEFDEERIQNLKGNALAALYLHELADAKRPKTLIPNPKRIADAQALLSIVKAYVAKCNKMGCKMELKLFSANQRDYDIDLCCDEFVYDLKSMLLAAAPYADEIGVRGATEERATVGFFIENVFIEAK